VRRPLPEVRSIQTQRLLKDAAKKREQAAKALARGKPAEAMTLTGEARSLEAAIPVPEMASPGGDVLDGKSVRAVIDGLAYMEANFSDGSKAIIARGRDGKAVGYISYQTDVTDQRLILSDLKVAPEYRRRGIGTRLVEQARDANPMALAQTNERTPDGAALFSTMPEVEVAPEYAEDMDSAGPPVPFPDWVIENDLASLAMNPGWVATDVRRSGLDDSWTPEVPEGGYASGWEQNEQGEWQSPGMKSPGPDGKFTETETANIRMAVLRPDEWAERVRAQVGKQDELLDMEPGATVTDASGTTWRKVKKPPPREPGLTRSWEADSPTWVTDDGDMETSGGVAAKIMAPQWREDTMASPTKYDWPHWERGNTQFPISLSPRDIFTKSSEDGPDGELPERLSSWLANYDDSVINEILGVGRIARMMGHETPPETVDALKRGERITVYRSVPRGGDHGTMPGAFVTPSRAYAEQHGESNLNGDYVIVSVEASADELLSHGDPSEFVWAPRDEDDALRQTQKAAEQQGVELPEGLMAVGMASPDFQGYIGDPTPDGADVERAVSRTIGDLSERYAGVIDIPWFVASNRDALPFTGDWADDFFVATVATAGYSPDEGQTEAEMPRIQRVVRADQIADLSDESARLVDSFGLSPAEAAETLGFTPLSQVRLGDWLESRGSLNSAYAIMISLAGVDGEVEPGRVMLVDDSAIIIRAISNILAGGNTRNTIVADGVESLEDIVQVIVAHEFGHLVGDRAIGRNNQMAEDARARAYVDLFEEYGITPLAIAAVSPYATVSPVESFAEMYALYFTNREDMSMIPSGPGSDESLAAAFGRLLSERIPDHGDEVLPGMNSPADVVPMTRQQIISMTQDDYANQVAPWTTEDSNDFDPTDPAQDAKFQRHMDAGRRWRASVAAAISLGELDPEVARERGFYGKPVDEWRTLPERTYHVTTAAEAIMATGLRTRRELALRNGKGLGAGPDDEISLTDNRVMADAIAAGMIEAGRMARGELTVHDMVAAAEAGVGADMPWMDKINRQFLGIEPEGNYTPEVQKMLDDERGVADGSLDPDEWIKTQETHLGIVHPGWEGVPGTETGQEAGTTGKPGFREMRQTRAADMADDRLRFYRNFAFWRQDAGGPLDPYFMGVDVADLARITPENVKVVEVERANPEVRGTFRLGLSEWRVPTGEALRPVLMRDPEPVTLSGREIDAMVMDSVMNSPAFPAAAAAGITVGPETPITRERADVVEAADREIARIAALWPGLRNSSFYAVDDEVSPVVEARDGGVAPDVVVSLGSQPLPREGGPWSDADLSPAAQARRHFYDGRGGPRKVNIHSYTDSKKDGSQVVVLTFDLVGDTSTHTVGGRLLARLTGRELRLDTELRDPRDPSRTITWSELSKETASEIRPRYGTKGWRSWADHGSRMVDGELRPEFDLSETDFPATREDLVRRFNTTVIHEIGHAVGAAILNDPDNPHREASYKRLFQQYGITPEEIAGVSKYATVSLAEAFAEMYAMRFSEMVDEMDPVLREKFDELLTNQLPDHQLPPVEVNPNQLSLSGMASPALPLAEARGFRTSRLEDAPGLASNPELTKVYDQTLAQLADRLPGLAEIPVLAHDDGRSRLLPDAPYYFRREGVTIQYSRTPKRGFAPLNTMTPKDRHIAELGSTTHLNDGDTIHRGVIVSSALALSGVNYSTFDRLTFLRDNATEGAQAIAVHEMGHIVGFSIVGFGPDVSHQEYIDLFKAYGVTPQEVAGVSEYATLTPAEAFAEIYTMFFTELRDDMDPSLRQKFENLMREEMPEHGLDPVRIVEAEESNASAYSPTPVTGMASPELPDRFGLPPYLGSELPRPLSRATTSDDLAGLWEQDAPTAMLDNLDLDSVTDEDVSRWRSVVYDLTQRSLLSRGLPEEFTVYRAGETYEGRPTNFRLTPGPYLGRPTTPYRVRREDIVIDSNAFFPYAFVGENEVVLRSGGLAQPETGMASPDEPSALPAVAALNSSLDTSAVTPLARRFPEQVSIMEDEFLRLNERWPEWKWYLDHLRLSDDERLVTTPWGKEKETSLIKDTTEGAYQIWWNEGNEENGWAAEKVRGMTIRLSRRGGDSHTVAGRLLESLTGTDLRRTLISWNADVEFGVSSSYDIWRRQGADDLTETGVATAEQVDRFFRIIVTHEIGHLVGEAILPFNSAYAAGDEHLAYRNLFKRYGITPEEIAGVSEYATTHPVEAFAEIYSMMFSEMVEEMDPALREKFESLLRSELPAHAIPEVRSVGVAPTGV
jgi:GNAT superfamily N-acetyltransferase/CheY-like chemotaxis protein